MSKNDWFEDLIDLTDGNYYKMQNYIKNKKKDDKKKEVVKNDKQGNTRGTKKVLGISK